MLSSKRSTHHFTDGFRLTKGDEPQFATVSTLGWKTNCGLAFSGGLE